MEKGPCLPCEAAKTALGAYATKKEGSGFAEQPDDVAVLPIYAQIARRAGLNKYKYSAREVVLMQGESLALTIEAKVLAVLATNNSGDVLTIEHDGLKATFVVAVGQVFEGVSLSKKGLKKTAFKLNFEQVKNKKSSVTILSYL